MSEPIEGVIVTPTQVASPWRATWRTVVEVGIPAFVVLLGVAPQILRMIVEDFEGVLPPEFLGWLAAAASVITIVAGTLARIAAIPAVNEWLARLKLDAGGGRHVAR